MNLFPENFTLSIYFTFIKVAVSQLPAIYTKLVSNGSVIREINVDSISTCYYKCWDLTYGCVAIGFKPSDLNRGKNEVPCYMIGGDSEDGEKLEMEVLVIAVITLALYHY